MWELLLCSPMKRYIAGYMKTNERRELYTKTFDEKERDAHTLVSILAGNGYPYRIEIEECHKSLI